MAKRKKPHRDKAGNHKIPSEGPGKKLHPGPNGSGGKTFRPGRQKANPSTSDETSTGGGQSPRHSDQSMDQNVHDARSVGKKFLNTPTGLKPVSELRPLLETYRRERNSSSSSDDEEETISDSSDSSASKAQNRSVSEESLESCSDSSDSNMSHICPRFETQAWTKNSMKPKNGL